MDFFAFSKMLPALLYPLPLFLLFILAIVIFLPRMQKRRWIRPVLAAAVVLLWFLSTPFCCRLMSLAWEEPRKELNQISAHYDAAVVLGGLSMPDVSSADRTEFNGRAERLIEAVELYKAGRVSKILITSGSGDILNQDDKEAPYLRNSAIRWGVKAEDVLMEDKSRNTYENAVFSKPIAEAAGLKKFLIITSAFHMKRSFAIFKKQGWYADSWPVDTMTPKPTLTDWLPQPWALDNNQILLKEFMGYIAYALAGYI